MADLLRRRVRNRPGGGGPALDTDRLGRGLRRCPGRPGALQAGDFRGGERVGPHPEQVAAVGVEEQQGMAFDADADAPTAQDLRGQHDVLAK